MVDLKRGKLYTFYGRLRMDANKLDEAHNYFMKALNCYGFPFPTEYSKIRFKVWWQNVIHWYRLHISTNVNWFYTIDSIFNDDLSECLQHLSALYLVNIENIHYTTLSYSNFYRNTEIISGQNWHLVGAWIEHLTLTTVLSIYVTLTHMIWPLDYAAIRNELLTALKLMLCN